MPVVPVERKIVVKMHVHKLNWCSSVQEVLAMQTYTGFAKSEIGTTILAPAPPSGTASQNLLQISREKYSDCGTAREQSRHSTH